MASVKAWLVAMVAVGLAAGGAGAAFPDFSEDFNTVPLDSSWLPIAGAVGDPNAHPGYCTTTDTNGGEYRIARWWYDYGGTAEWDLEVRLLPAMVPNAFQGVGIWNTLGGGRRLDFGFFVERFNQLDGILVGSSVSDLYLAGSTTAQSLVWTPPLRQSGGETVTEVQLMVKKRSQGVNESADDGRMYIYYRATIDDGVNPPTDTGWLPFCYQKKANYGWSQNGPAQDDLLIDMYGQDLGAGEVWYDYFHMRSPDGPVTPAYCGDFNTVYEAMDFDGDCAVNLVDFAAFAAAWMRCTDPQRPECDPYWLP